MTFQDATTVLGLLTAAWPNQDMPAETAELWIGMLSELDVDDAKSSARTVIRNDQWFPSIARFIQVAEAAKHARENRFAAQRGLPSVGRSVPPPQRLIEATRQLLAEQAKKKHWHGGPDPCPVCGGMKSPTVNRRSAGRKST